LARKEDCCDVLTFSVSFRDAIHGGLEILPLGRELPLVVFMIQALPEYIAMLVDPGLTQYLGGIQKGSVPSATA
jgi:hypothetical protein